MERVVVFGNGDFAQVVDFYLSADSSYDVVAFTVNNEYIHEPTFCGKPVVPFENLLQSHPPNEYRMFVAVGFSKVNRVRADLYAQCKDNGYQLISYVNSRATYWGELNIGDNCFIFENNVIQPFVTIGNNVAIWSGNHLGHHCTVGDHCFITSHTVISGRATIGASSFIGVNATIGDHVTVGRECVIGAGALILKDTDHRAVFKGAKSEPSKITSDRLKGF